MGPVNWYAGVGDGGASYNTAFSSSVGRTPQMADAQAQTLLQGVKYQAVGNAKARASRPHASVPCIILTLIIAAASLTGTVILWCTNYIDSAVIQYIVLRNNSQVYKFWKDPPTHRILKLWVYNYTNAEEFLRGEETKLKVEDIGPFVFRDNVRKINVEFNDEDSVFFNYNSTFEFVPELSKDPNNTNIVILNVPVISAVSLLSERSATLQSLASMALSATNSRPFVNLTPHEVMWGYKEVLMSLSPIFSYIGISATDLRLGIIQRREGLNPTRYEVSTGKKNIEDINRLVTIDEEEYMPEWGETHCGKVDGTDGTMNSPIAVQQKKPILLYDKQVCRTIPFIFKRDVERFGLPVREYEIYRETFSHPDINPDNKCYCTESGCPPSGIFNVSKCFDGAPLYMSLPHMSFADKNVQNNVIGQRPDLEEHMSNLFVHPLLGTAIAGSIKLQANVMVTKSPRFRLFDKFPQDIILPFSVLEMSLDGPPPEIYPFLYHASYTLNCVKESLKVFMLILFIGSVLYLFYTINKITGKSLVKPSIMLHRLAQIQQND